MKKLAALLLLVGIAAGARAADLAYNNGPIAGSVVNAVLSPTQNVDLDLNANGIGSLSVQVIYSSAITSAIAFTDGVTATGNITVSNLTGLSTSYATNNITITSNTALAGSTLYVNGSPLKEGGPWSYNVSYASMTAVSLCAALNTAYSGLFLSTVTSPNTVIYSTAVTVGSAPNTFTMTSSTPAALTVASANFTGGQDNAALTIANYPLVANVDYYPGPTAAVTATRIATAINAKGGLKSIVVAAGSAGVVYATSTATGKFTNYSMTSSTPACLTLSGAVMTGGTDSDITLSTLSNPLNGYGNYSYIAGLPNPALSTIKKTPTALGIGHPLLFTKSAGTAPTPLSAGTTYYATNLTASSFQLSDTSTGAVAGVIIAITTQTTTGGGSFTLTPIALTGTPSFKFQSSNDGVNFNDLYVISSTASQTTPLQASVSFASPYTAGNVMYNLPKVLFRYLRLAFTGGTFGGVNINEVVNARKE